MKLPFDKHIHEMLLLGKKIIKTSPLLANEVGTTNVKGDKTIGMDVQMEKGLINYIKENKLPCNIFSEEIGMIQFHPNPSYTVVFDPLDGSTNYKLGKNIYPYGLLVAIYKGISPKLQDVISAGAIEFTQNLGWIYKDKKTYSLLEAEVELKADWKIDKHLPVYLDLYYKEGYKAYLPLAEKVFIRNTGSTIGNLSYLLSNISAGISGICMRPEEIGAIISLIKGAGGIAVDLKGNNLGEQNFSINNTYQLLAGNKDVVNFMLSNLV